MITDLAAYEEVRRLAEGACLHYEKSAPTVSRWADRLFVMVDEEPEHVSFLEVLALFKVMDADGSPMSPQFAANYVYKIMDKLGQDTTGHAGF
jgi:hypothetical protein